MRKKITYDLAVVVIGGGHGSGSGRDDGDQGC